MRSGDILPFVFTVVAIWACLAASAVADESGESPPQYQLDLIVTTAQRASEEFLYTVEDLSVEDLRERDVQTVAQALNYLPGIRTKTARVGHGQYVYLRGFEQQHLLILVDGVPIYNPYDGLVELDHIPSEQILGIRVVKGPSSATYGPNALGGVIQIITKNSHEKLDRGMVLELGQNGTSNLRLHYGYGHGPLYLRISGSRSLSDGYRLSGDFKETEVPRLPDGQGPLHYEDGGRRENSDYAKNAGHLALGYAPSERFRLTFSGSVVDNEWGVPPHVFYNSEKNKTSIRYWRFNEWRQGMANLAAMFRLSQGFSARIGAFFNKYDNTLDSYDDENYSSQEMPYAFHSVYDDHSMGGHLQLESRLGPADLLTIGGGVIQDLHRDTQDIEEPTTEFVSHTWWVFAEDRVRLSERTSGVVGLNYALLDNKKAGDLAVAGNDATALNPHVSVACLTSQSTRAYLSLARLTRFASLKQLFGDGGNPQLKAQKTNHLELGWEWFGFPEARLRGVLFYDNIRDFIEGNFLSRTTVNVEKARLYGGELTFQASPGKGLRFTLGYSYLRARNRSPQRPGDYLQYRPQHKLDWSFWAQLPYQFKVLFYGSALSQQHFYDDFNDRQLSHLSPYVVANLSVRKKFSSHVEPFLAVTNLLDAAYQEVYTSPAPGRETRLGLALTW